MDISTVDKCSQIILMPGVTSVTFSPERDQVWISIKGHEEAHEVVSTVEKLFDTKAIDHSNHQCWKEKDMLNYSIYPGELIFEITGFPKEKALAKA